MSYFSREVSVPKNTQIVTPLTQSFDIQHGVIHKIYVRVYSGHAGLTGIRLLRGLHQIAPTSGGEWFKGDDATIEYGEFIEVLETPYNLTIEAYNLDTKYLHAFLVGVGVLPRWVLLPQEILRDILKGVSDILLSMTKWFGVKI